MELILLEGNSTIWVANLVSAGVVLTIIGFFFKRYVNQQDEKYKELEKKTSDCDDRSDKIETNYISRFDAVNKEINRSNKELQSELVQEIRAVTKEKADNEKDQAVAVTRIEGKVEHLQKTFDQILRVLK